VTYRVRVRTVRAVGAVVTLALLSGIAAAGSGAGSHAAKLRLDGMPFTPELALTSNRRATGLMNRRQAPRDGMLFVFPDDTSGGFWMKNTLVPLRILFFDAKGKRVRAFRMTPCREDPCRIYEPGRLYRFALELRVTDRRKGATLGPLRELRRLARVAA
jgi:uncharacterized membrane protein (UPF0127 family)